MKEHKPSVYGPRMLKNPQSVEFALQTWMYVQRCYESHEISEREFNDALKEAEQYRIYERISPGYPSLDALLKAKLGVTTEQAIEDVKLRAPGRPSKKETQKGDIVTFSDKRGTNGVSYLTARIARDRPDILERMKAGEYRSVRAAAIDAGIVKPRTPVQELQRWWSKASAEERHQFIAWVETQLEPLS